MNLLNLIGQHQGLLCESEPSSFTYERGAFTGDTGSNEEYYGNGALLNGKVYMAPTTADYGIAYDIESNSVEQLFPIPYSYYAYGGCVEHNGDIIYSPWNYWSIGIYDTALSSFSITQNISGTHRFIGACKKGSIAYFTPWSDHNIGIYNIDTDSYQSVSTGLSDSYWGDGCVLGNYVVFANRRNSKSVILDTTDNSVSYSGDAPDHDGTDWFAGSVSVSDTKAILIPYDSPYVGIYDLTTNTITKGAIHNEGTDAFFNGCVVGDYVIMAPHNSDHIGIYNWVDDVYIQGDEHGESSFGGAIYDESLNKVILTPKNSQYVGIVNVSVSSGNPPEGVVTLNNTSGQGASISLGDVTQSLNVDNDFTLEMFVENFDSGNSYCRLFTSTDNTSTQRDYIVTISGDHGNIAGVSIGSARVKITLVYTGSTKTYSVYKGDTPLFLDTTEGVPFSGIDSWWIGTPANSPNDNYYVTCDLSCVAVYDYIKSDLEIVSNYLIEPSLSDSGIIRYYTGANDGTNLFEYVEGDHGTMNNFL